MRCHHGKVSSAIREVGGDLRRKQAKTHLIVVTGPPSLLARIAAAPQYVTMPAQTNSSLPESLEVGGYRIVKKISSGGFSIVYLATDEQGNSVAIKEYMPAALAQRKPGELSPYIATENLNTYRIGLKCFFEEGRALASIYHPNIVRVINFFARTRRFTW
jgi:serine/threonine protein kinase